MIILDWIVLSLYIIAVVAMSYFIGRKQKNQSDYYLGGRSIAPWQVGTSMAANQVSAISLVGAPAFIALKTDGGLKWLQYELAIPLAMIGIIIFLVPVFRSTGGITIYQFLEKRFGRATRSMLSLVFLVSRSLATGVALLATAYVTSICIDLNLTMTIIIIGIISLLYTCLGGIKADIYSDILQLIILWGSAFAVIGIILYNIEGVVSFINTDLPRLQVFDLQATGFKAGETFSLLPMVLGGFFLYISYYGCDQSQAQRLLTTSDNDGAQKSLLTNSLIRFPLVLTYCSIGVLMIPFLHQNPEFAQKLGDVKPDQLMPYFFNDYVPAGLLGLIIAGIFAASMSSLDSNINSLSAATWEDFLVKIVPSLENIEEKRKVYFSRCITVIWGLFAIGAAVLFDASSDTVIELVNKIGSAFYGPIAGVFILGILTRRVGQGASLIGFISGLTVNLMVWLNFESVSWMWWNLIGFFVTVVLGLMSSFVVKRGKVTEDYGTGISLKNILAQVPKGYVVGLVVWFVVIVGISVGVEVLL